MTGDPLKLTEAERKVIDLLGQATNEFFNLLALHPADKQEFVAAIHAAQNIVLARPGMRDYGWRNESGIPVLEPSDKENNRG